MREQYERSSWQDKLKEDYERAESQLLDREWDHGNYLRPLLT